MYENVKWIRSVLSDGDLALGNLSSLALLLDVDCLFSGEELDVCLTREVGSDSSVGSVGTSPSLGGSVNLDVVDGEVLQVLDVGVGLEVVDQSEHSLHTLLGPSAEGLAELCGLAGSADASVVLGVGDAASVGEDVLEVLFGLGDGESLDGLGSLVGVLIVDSEVSAGGAGDWVSREVPLEVEGFLE
jgi:hypothetical protein